MTSRSDWRIAKTEAVAEHGMVTADNPLAVEAGLTMLREGGNAVDAAVATAFAMGVVEPFSSGVGGVAAMVIYQAAADAVVVIDGSTTAPRAAREDMYELVADADAREGMYRWRATKGRAQHDGWRSVGVPGAVAAYCLALTRYGRLDRRRVMAPAIRLATDGFDVDWYLALAIAAYAERLWPSPEAKRIFFRPSGAPLRPPMGLEPGDRLAQGDLAATLATIAEEGPDVFYRGAVARAIAEDAARQGGLITPDDLGGYQVGELEPLRADYRGHALYSVPRASGAATVVEALNILEGYALGAASEADRLHLTSEASRRAFLDRFAFLADPAAVDAPVDVVVSKEYAAERRRTIDPRRASPDARAGSLRAPLRGSAAAADAHTTHICAVDAERNMVSLTTTLGQAFGSGVVPRGTGVVVVDAMTWFDPEPGHVNSIAPGKRILWAVAPTLAFRDGLPFLALGAPGGRRLITAVLQSLVNVVDLGLGPQEAVNGLRVHCEGPETLLDARAPQALRAELAGRGHVLTYGEETFASTWFGRPNAILVERDASRLRGGVNRLKRSLAAGL